MSGDLTEIICRHWGWTGIKPESVTAVSRFGHLVVKDVAAEFWYLDPELRELARIATSDVELAAYFSDEDVRLTWKAEALADAARTRLGEPGDGRCYSLKFSALIQGDYAPENLCTYSIAELIAVTGDFERQTRDWPEGQKFTLKVVD